MIQHRNGWSHSKTADANQPPALLSVKNLAWYVRALLS